MFSSARSLLLGLAVAFAAAAGARADVLILANGDRIKGTLVKNVDGIITFKSDILGELVIPTTKASVEVELTAEQKAALAKAAAEKAAAEKLAAEKAAAEKAKATASAPQTKPVKRMKKPKTTAPFAAVDLLTAARTPERATKVEDTGWINRIEFGLVSQSGRTDKTDIDLRTENNRRTPKSEIRFLNRYIYGETDDKRTTDSFASDLRYRRTLSRKLFFQSNTHYARNSITRIECDGEQGFGLGFNMITLKNLVVAIGSDAALRYNSYMAPIAGGPAPPSQTTRVFDFFQDLSLTINQRFSLTQDFRAMMAPSNEDDYKINFNTSLVGKVTNTFDIVTRLAIEYDRKLAEDLRYSQRISTSLVYVF